VSIKDYSVRQARFSFDYERRKDTISLKVQTKNAAGYKITFAPAMGIGTKFTSLIVDGKPEAVETKEKAQVVQAVTEIPVKNGMMQFDLGFIPTVEILPVVPKTRVGDGNKGLKMISVKKEASRLMIKVEGLARRSYALRITNPGMIAKVEGAELKDDDLILRMPEGTAGQFVSHRIILHLQ